MQVNYNYSKSGTEGKKKILKGLALPFSFAILSIPVILMIVLKIVSIIF